MSDKATIHFEKQVIKFTKKPAKMGRHFGFLIPASYISNGLLDPKKTYTVYIAPADPEDKEMANDK